MECFDIIDEFGRLTGKIAPRDVCHAKGYRHHTAHVWVVRYKDGKPQILLQLRAFDKDSYPGQWDTSCAGHVPAGETTEQGALRELSEELGIKTDKDNLKFLSTMDIDYTEVFHGKKFIDKELAYVYLYEVPENTRANSFEFQEEEIAAVSWFDLDFVLREIDRPAFKNYACIPRFSLSLLAKHFGKEFDV